MFHHLIINRCFDVFDNLILYNTLSTSYRKVSFYRDGIEEAKFDYAIFITYLVDESISYSIHSKEDFIRYYEDKIVGEIFRIKKENNLYFGDYVIAVYTEQSFLINQGKTLSTLNLMSSISDGKFVFLDNSKDKEESIEEICSCIRIGEDKILALKYIENEKREAESIIHAIEFPPEYRQAGIGILNYFGEVLHQRYPDIPVTLRIEQAGLIVRMIIETLEGHREIVERTLASYGLVLHGKILPEELLPNPHDLLAFKHKLELTKMELRFTYEMLQLSKEENKQLQHRVISLETDMVNLQQLVGNSLQATRDSQRHTQELTSLFQPLLAQFTQQHDTVVQQALRTLEKAVQHELTSADEATVKGALVTIQEHEPGVIRQLRDLVYKGAITGASGRLLAEWLLQIGAMLR